MMQLQCFAHRETHHVNVKVNRKGRVRPVHHFGRPITIARIGEGMDLVTCCIDRSELTEDLDHGERHRRPG